MPFLERQEAFTRKTASFLKFNAILEMPSLFIWVHFCIFQTQFQAGNSYHVNSYIPRRLKTIDIIALFTELN